VNGKILTLTFKVKAGTAAGTYNVELTNQKGRDHDMKEVTFAAVNGSVTVSSDSGANTVVVTFDGNGGTPASTPVNVKSGDKVTAPATNPTREGYEFAGWFTDKEGKNAFDQNTPITANITVYARWKATAVETYVVTFDGNGGTPASTTVNVKSGDLVGAKKPADPTRDGYEFTGWFTDKDGKNAFNVEKTAITGAITLYAGWKEKTDTTNGGGCYIATSVYGSYDTPEVWTLRRFRDDVLGQTWYGRLFIKAYYATSPTLVRLFGDAEWFQNFWRDKLDTLVQSLQDDGFESTPYQDKDW
jgi:uncharacterized repeat protein (TIGR02543 family)